MIIEACVESPGEALKAERQGATRIELCADLEHDGLTPDTELVKYVTTALTIPVMVMVRPRPGNFVYTHDELQQMLSSIELLKSYPVSGIVTGALQENNEVDPGVTKQLVQAAHPLPVTFHKAIDLVPDMDQAIAQLKAAGVRAILSSGQAATAHEGAARLKQMIVRAGKEIQVICAGKITQNNLPELHRRIGASAYHGRKIAGEL